MDIGLPISQKEANDRVKENRSIMCSDYKSAHRIAIKFPSPKLEMNEGTFGQSGFYPHFHINGGHGDPHIWFFPAP